MSVPEEITISVAASPDDIAAARELFSEYAAWLGLSLCFQGFDEELATLPGKYASAAGRLLLARCGGVLAGCGALRALELGTCEMPSFRRNSWLRHVLGQCFVPCLGLDDGELAVSILQNVIRRERFAAPPLAFDTTG
jgi:hypothetical protein